jgi:hypothetical protein
MHVMDSKLLALVTTKFETFQVSAFMPFVYVLIAFLAGFAVGLCRRAYLRRFQNYGEALLSRCVQKNFDAPDYHLMNHLTLPLRDGTTQVDHVLVSRFGVFVIETKDYKGWIFAGEKHRSWTQVLFNSKFRFQNPILQNQMHVQVVRSLLEFLPPEAIKSAVVFTGDAEFRTKMPEGVFNLPQFMGFIQMHTEEVMSLNRMQFCVGRLETMRLAVTRETDVEHVENIHRRHRKLR